MSQVVVMLPGVLRAFADDASAIEVEARTVGEALEHVGARFPLLLARLVTPGGELRRYVNVFVGEISIRQAEGLATRLDAGAVVTILPAVAGG
jgi:molybdopterin converting factor small subunit